MEIRPEPRVPVFLPVRVFGMSADGRPFFQAAHVENISSDGALLTGVEHALAPGEVVGVQYLDKKARFSVVWHMDSGQIKKAQVGIKLVEGQTCPWLSELERPAEVTTAKSEEQRRRYSRHKLSFPLELRTENRTAPMQTSATDISGRGCYVETIMPFAIETVFKISFWLDQEKIETEGVVRAKDPGFGMGIEFTGLSTEDQDRIQRFLDAHDSQSASAAAGDGANS